MYPIVLRCPLDEVGQLMSPGNQILDIEHPHCETAEESRRTVPPPTNPMGVARELVKQLYTHTDGQLLLRAHKGDFYRWDGTCWPEAEARAVRGAAYKWLEHAVYLKDSAVGPIHEPWDPTARKINDLVDALKAIAHLSGKVETPAWLKDGPRGPSGPGDRPLFCPHETVSVRNGLLHVPTLQLLDHTPDFWSHNSLPFNYDPNAPEPKRWLGFLAELWGDDQEAISTLQEIFGYLIGGDTRQQKILLLVGPKRSGKGTIGRVLTGLLGKHNVAAPTLAGMATNFGLSPLIDRPLALISDARLSSRADTHIVVERLLSVSGEDSITIDRKYKEPWTGRLPTRFLVLSNELPRLEDSSGALSSRFIMLVLTKSFYGKENPSLTAELLEEASGVFNWAMGGLDRLMARGYFEQPQSGAEAIRQMEDLASPIAAFIREECVTDAPVSLSNRCGQLGRAGVTIRIEALEPRPPSGGTSRRHNRPLGRLGPGKAKIAGTYTRASLCWQQQWTGTKTTRTTYPSHSP